MNLVMTGKAGSWRSRALRGRAVFQGGARKLLALGEKGIKALVLKQKEILK